MEFSNSHLAVLNEKMPPGFVIEPVAMEEIKPKRTEAEKLRSEIRFHIPPPSYPPPAREKLVSVSKTSKSEGFRKIYNILQKLKNHPSIGPFLQPVDKNKITDYYDIIHCPIDVSLIEKRLVSNQYVSSKDFAADVRRMWSNSFLYNSRGTDIYLATIELSAFFENLIKGSEDVSILPEPTKEPTLPRVQISPQANIGFSDDQKRALGAKIRRLDAKYYKGVFEIVKNATGAGSRGEEFEFDIDLLPQDVCQRLETYVNQWLPNAHATLPPVQLRPNSPAASSDSSGSSDSDVSPAEAEYERPALTEEPNAVPAEQVSTSVSDLWNSYQQTNAYYGQ